MLHYLDNGSANLCITYNKEIFFIPAVMILKCLKNVSDYEIYRCLMRHRENNSFIEGNIKFSLRQLQENKDACLLTQNDILKYIGSRWRVKLQLPEWYTDIECAQYLFKHYLLIHLNEDSDKFNLLM